MFFFFFFQAEDGIRDLTVTGVQTCALPISCLCALRRCIRVITREMWARSRAGRWCNRDGRGAAPTGTSRSEEHTSELQSQSNLVCRLLLEKKKKPETKNGVNGMSRCTEAPP